MALVKVRRDGNSLAVTIPHDEARKAHLEEGMYVDVAADPSGELRVEPVSIQRRARPEVITVADRVLAKKRGLYDRLAAYDADSD